MPGREPPPRPAKPSGPSRDPRPREKLQKGGPKSRGRGPKGPKGPKMPLAERVRTMPARWRKRHEAKKRRLARMTRKRRWLRRAGLIATWFLAIIALFMSTTVVLFYTVTNVPRPEDLPLPKTATILYSDGSVMAQQYLQNRTIVSLSQVPETVRFDVLSAEDRGFYSEPGISLRGTARALLTDVTGGDTQGGSGITQQYVKNAYLNDSRSVTRKVKELMIALKLSREYSKDDILGFYLNTVYFGRGAYGIQAASETYFHVGVSQLNVSQGAVLAALLRAPSYYDPANNLSAAKGRWQYVLDGMVSTGHLTKAQEAKLTYPNVAAPVKSSTTSGPNELIVAQVLAELAQHGISSDELYSRGLTIRTTISRTAQTDAVNAIKQTFATLTPQQRNMKNALVAISPSTGAVIAYYGGPNGRNYAGHTDEYDYAGVGSRPPGSSFKPYTLATVLGQTLAKTPGKPATTLSSKYNGSYCVTIEGRKICNDPSDYSVSSPSLTVANAMKYSLNTTFDLLAVQAGPDNVATTAHAAGIAAKDAQGQPTLVDADGNTGFNIGIGGYAVRPVDQADGFATFENNGVYNAPYFVQSVTDSNGAVIYRHTAAPKQTINPEVANDVTLSMEPIAAYSGDGLTGNRPSAAKTGTEGIGDTADNSDAWMVGFTPQVSVAVWVGSGNSTTPIYNSYGGAEYGRDLPGATWKLFLDTYLSGKPAMSLPNKQEIGTGINLTTPTPSKTPSKSASTSAPSSPTGPTTPAGPTTPLTPTTPPPSTSSSPCGGILQPTCPPSSP
jgi:membrane peptidoglycan carboxypeptidase